MTLKNIKSQSQKMWSKSDCYGDGVQMYGLYFNLLVYRMKVNHHEEV